MGRFDDAEAVLLREYESAVAMLGPDHFRARAIASQIGELNNDLRQSEQADQWRAKSGSHEPSTQRGGAAVANKKRKEP